MKLKTLMPLLDGLSHIAIYENAPNNKGPLYDGIVDETPYYLLNFDIYINHDEGDDGISVRILSGSDDNLYATLVLTVDTIHK